MLACDTSHHAADPGNKCKYLMCVHKKWLQLPCGPGTVWKGNGCVADVKESENCPKGIVDGKQNLTFNLL